jgi:hypothetical protein
MVMPTRQSPVVAALLGVITAGLLVGCAGGTAQPGGQVSANPSGSSSVTPSGGSPSGSPSSSQSPYHSYSPGELTLTGQVQEGVEAGCLVMTSGGQTYQLVGGDRQVLRAGKRVTVRGRPTPGMVTICQQGTPFEVVEARPA